MEKLVYVSRDEAVIDVLVNAELQKGWKIKAIEGVASPTNSNNMGTTVGAFVVLEKED